MFSTCEKNYLILKFLEIIFVEKYFVLTLRFYPKNLASLEAIKEKQT